MAINPDNEDVIRQVKNMMTVSGLWPNAEQNLLYKTRKFVSWMVSILQTVFMMHQLYENLNYIDRVTDVLCLIATYGSFMIKLAIFRSKKHRFLVIMKELHQGSFVDYPNEFDGYIKDTISISNYVTRMYQLSCFAVIGLYTLKPLILKDGQELPIEVTFNVSRFYYFYHFFYFFEVFSLLSTAWNNSSLDALAMGLMGIASAQLDILKDKILKLNEVANKNLSFKNADQALEDQVKDCVQHHIDIINYVENIENVFSVGFLTQFLDSLVVICTIGFQVAHASSLQFVLMIFYFFAMIMQLTLYCWFGNDVMFKSRAVGDACYDSDWYKFNLNTRRSLFIIMERAKRPLKLTAGKFSDLSLISFMSIIRSSYSYFALMQRLYAKSQNALHNHRV